MRPDERDSSVRAVQRADCAESLRLRRRLGRARYLAAILADSDSDDDRKGRRSAVAAGGRFAWLARPALHPAR